MHAGLKVMVDSRRGCAPRKAKPSLTTAAPCPKLLPGAHLPHGVWLSPASPAPADPLGPTVSALTLQDPHSKVSPTGIKQESLEHV